MRVVLINLERAHQRRERMAVRFARIGLDYEVWPATDARLLTDDDRRFADQETRRRRGLHPIPDGSLANALSQRAAMRALVEDGPAMMAVFEDDSTFDESLRGVLAELEDRADLFDLVILQRRNLRKPFVPCTPLANGHMLGRVRFSDYGSNGYVITRSAARTFLENNRRMTREIDHALSHFWENGLNVFYVDPPVVSCDDSLESQIANSRLEMRRVHRDARRRRMGVLTRKISTIIRNDIRRRRAFARLRRADRRTFRI